jgi:hypothetical protein
MTLDEFKAARSANTTPGDLPPAVLALWHDAKGDWDGAHRAVQDLDDESGAWVHAYLHRKEGDASNAAYWYRRAGQPVARGALEDEWEAIAAALLSATR